MKKIFLLILPIFLGLPAVFGNSVSAYKYNIVSSPVLVDPIASEHSLYFTTNGAPMWRPGSTNYFLYPYASLTWQDKIYGTGCLFDSIRTLPYFTDQLNRSFINYDFIYMPDYWDLSSLSVSSPYYCRRSNLSTSGLLLDSEDWIGSKDYPRNYTGIPPDYVDYAWGDYWYPFDSFYFNNREANNGLGQKLGFETIIDQSYDKDSFGMQIDDQKNRDLPLITGFQFPLPHVNDSDIGPLTYGRHLHLQGELMLDFDQSLYKDDGSGELAVSLDDIFGASISTFGIDGFTELGEFPTISPNGSISSKKVSDSSKNQDKINQSRQCDVRFSFNDVPDEYPVLFDFACDLTLQNSYYSDFYVLYFRVTDFLDYQPKHIGVDSFYLVTDDDYTPMGDIGGDVKGFDTNIAPGSGNQYDFLMGDSSGGFDLTGFFNQIANDFSFNLQNPFSGLFHLFRNGDDCVNFPQLADLISAPTDTVCPFFNDKIRSIVTPVFGISGSLLIAGIAIHWLSRSTSKDTV